MTRTEFLRENTKRAVHKCARAALPKDWSVSEYPGTVAERKAAAIALMFDRMPLYIGPQELIVGSRTLYGHRNEETDPSDMEVAAMPHYLSEGERQEFGGIEAEFVTKGHYTPDFSRILNKGIDGILQEAADSMVRQKSGLKKGWVHGVILAWEGVSRLIIRYGEYARQMAEEETEQREKELLKIAGICSHIAHKPPRDLHEALQLLWFSILAATVENFRWICYGRVDQILFPYYNTVLSQEAQQLIDCFVLKLSDGCDIRAEYFGEQAGQQNITLGGVTPEGKDAVNPVTFAFLDALERIRLPEPEVACRVHSLNPPEYLRRCAELSVSGINTLAYYNDDCFIASMTAAGIPERAARDYAFDLCQDINIPGRADFFNSGSVDLGCSIAETMAQVPEGGTFPEFMEAYKKVISANIRSGIEAYNLREKAVREYVAGYPEFLYDQMKEGNLTVYEIYPLLSPLPVTSVFYEQCVETATDLCWYGCVLGDRGFCVTNPVVGVNSLAALRKRVFEEKRFSLSEVRKACEQNFEGQEKMRQLLWTAPKWGNDDDFVDIPAKEVLEFACDEILKYRTSAGARHLAGIHQAHPVSSGWKLPATPEGRKAGEPVPVSLSPENGTLLNGPTAALRSAAKIDFMKYQWNFCVMLQYYASVFEGNDGAGILADLTRSYFSLGGTQHQPNVVNKAELIRAQHHPEEYKDLIVRMWGVSAHFVDLPREVQNEFIARLDSHR